MPEVSTCWNTRVSHVHKVVGQDMHHCGLGACEGLGPSVEVDVVALKSSIQAKQSFIYSSIEMIPLVRCILLPKIGSKVKNKWMEKSFLLFGWPNLWVSALCYDSVCAVGRTFAAFCFVHFHTHIFNSRRPLVLTVPSPLPRCSASLNFNLCWSKWQQKHGSAA